MKGFVLRLIFLGGAALPLLASGQLIGNIVHEPFRDKVLITYDINGLAPQQRMEVNLYCSDNNFKDEVKSISGNGAGPSVTGNGQKTIIWDVLKDRNGLEGKIS